MRSVLSVHGMGEIKMLNSVQDPSAYVYQEMRVPMYDRIYTLEYYFLLREI